jgi:branched-chain amino acid transport system substrate-binding protein
MLAGENSMAGNEFRIGALATLLGPFAAMGADSMRGVELALGEFNGEICGKKIRLFKEGSNAMPEDAYVKAQELIERQRVDFMIGPLSGNEGIAVRDYAKTRPERAFINGIAGAQEMTLRDAAPNFYSFTTNGVQFVAGLGSYAYHTQGYRRVAILAEDYSFPYSQVGGFMIEFCKAGGKVVKKFWVPLGTTNYRTVIAEMPADIDAIFVALGGTDAVNFLQQYHELGGKLPLIGGTLTVDQTVLNTKGELAERVIGMASSGPIADDNPDPNWQKFVQAYKAKFPDGFASPSMFAHGYYINTKAALLALRSIEGDLSDNQARFKAALSRLEFITPSGPVRLDHNRQAIASTFVKIVDKQTDGSLYNRLVKPVPYVNNTLGMLESDYLKIGPFGRDNPSGV